MIAALLLAWLPAARAEACATWGSLELVGVIEAGSPDELSGLAASPTQDGVYWGHDDAGQGAAVYALSEDGAEIGRFIVDGATNTDWEDMAAGPCADGCACLFLSDAGDNDGVREEVSVVRVREPLGAAGLDDARTDPAETITVRDDDGPHDAEALLVDRRTGDGWLVAKDAAVARVYSLPGLPEAIDGDVLDAVLWGTLDLVAAGATDAAVTAGSVSPSGDRVALRTDTDVIVFDGPEGGGVEGALAVTPVAVAAETGAKGEAMTWSADGTALLLGDEGEHGALYLLACEDGVAEALVMDAELCLEDGKRCGCASAPGPAAGLLVALAGAWGRRRRRDSDQSH